MYIVHMRSRACSICRQYYCLWCQRSDGPSRERKHFCKAPRKSTIGKHQGKALLKCAILSTQCCVAMAQRQQQQHGNAPYGRLIFRSPPPSPKDSATSHTACVSASTRMGSSYVNVWFCTAHSGCKSRMADHRSSFERCIRGSGGKDQAVVALAERICQYSAGAPWSN